MVRPTAVFRFIAPALELLAASALAAAPAPVARERTWIEDSGFRHAALLPAVSEAPQSGLFFLLPPAHTGLAFTNRLDDASSAANRVLENGSGLAVGDFDGDDLPDVFLCGLAGDSALYRNLGGWRFTNVTAAAGLPVNGEIARGAVFADLDGDGRPDLLVSTLARGVRCFLNQGGRFRDATPESGLGEHPGSTTLALTDIDGDGTLDLYVTRYRAEDIRDNANVETRIVGGRTELHPKYRGRLFLGPQGLLEFGEPDTLYLNDGRARFREVSWTDGRFLDEQGKPLSEPPRDWGLTASFRDIDDDGLPDLYVCNDYWTPDRLWLNAGQGRFRAAPREALRHTSENSMGVDFADVDRDGHVDFLVLDMLSRDSRMRRRQVLAQTPVPSAPGEILNRPQIMRNVLFLSRGDGTFAEVADYAGLPASEWSWQPLFLDVDLDGFEDVLIPAGHRRDVQDLDATEKVRALQHPWPAGMDPAARQRLFTRESMEHARLYPTLEMPVIAFRNRGDLRFEDVTAAWGFETLGVHQGAALADFDLDGDLDLVVNRLNGPAGLYRNDSVGPRIAVRLRGLAPNTQGIGARVRLVAVDAPASTPSFQVREIVAGGRYLSGSEPLVVFGTGSKSGTLRIEVRWRNGRVSRVPKVTPGRLYEIDERDAEAPAASSPSVPADSLFEDVSDRLGHTHVENPFDDFARHPLLPRGLSRSGPGIAWFDWNTDGWEDLAIASGAGGRLGIFTNDTRGGFRPAPTAFDDAPVPRDLVSVAAFRDRRGRARLLVGSSSYEEPARPLPGVVDRAAFAAGGGAALPDGGSAVGPLALADVDGDGDLDLFVGGRSVGGLYPEPAASQLFLQEEGGWRPDPVNGPLFEGLGLVSGAVWGDLDEDGDADLVLACEWSPVRVLRNDAGRLVEVTREWGLEPWSGWWNGVTLGDLDGDGRLDIVAANWGLNGPWTANADRPAVLYFGDFLGRGVVDVLETEWDTARDLLVPRQRLDVLQASWPTLRAHFPTHRSFTEATADDVLRSFGNRFRRLEARTLASMAFFNRGGRFEARELPREAQFAPAFAVVVADFDGDGVEDVFLSQNFAALPWQTPRLDAGQGLLLRGTGGGNLEPLPPARSGIGVHGEQRGAAAADFDRDGRLDLAVAQNGAATRIYRNRGAAPGLRVRLEGPPSNPAGVGAILRTRVGDRWGPSRAVLAGSGYASQDSSTVILAHPGAAAFLQVRWPGGRKQEASVPADAREMMVTFDH